MLQGHSHEPDLACTYTRIGRRAHRHSDTVDMAYRSQIKKRVQGVLSLAVTRDSRLVSLTLCMHNAEVLPL